MINNTCIGKVSR